MTDPKAPPAPVEQRHRDAAADFYDCPEFEDLANGCRSGRLDHDDEGLVQAFARFERDHCTRADALREVVERCRDVFAEYAELHRRKLPSCVTSTEHKAIIAKVERNRDMADMCIAALSDAPQAAPDELGRVKVAIKKALDGIWPIVPDDVDDCANIAAKAALAAMEGQP